MVMPNCHRARVSGAKARSTSPLLTYACESVHIHKPLCSTDFRALEGVPCLPRHSQALAKALPLASTARTWGKEVYFDTGVSVSRETGAREVVEPGTVAFWTDGEALALPWLLDA
ncbi:hypothetical protein GCM10010244_05510 [Streptomyces coeruleorubidus]|nr:hypothetical protein GCM10010244_05510 [Streptomyces bellus]